MRRATLASESTHAQDQRGSLLGILVMRCRTTEGTQKGTLITVENYPLVALKHPEP